MAAHSHETCGTYLFSIFALLSDGDAGDEAPLPNTEYQMCDNDCDACCCCLLCERAPPPWTATVRLASFVKSPPDPQVDPQLNALASTTPPTTSRACLGGFTLMRRPEGNKGSRRKGWFTSCVWRLANKGQSIRTKQPPLVSMHLTFYSIA